MEDKNGTVEIPDTRDQFEQEYMQIHVIAN